MIQLSRSDMNLAIIQFAICRDVVQQLLKRTYELHDLILERTYHEFATQFEAQMKKDILADLRKIVQTVDESVLKAFE